MIRYPVSWSDIETSIDAIDPNWSDKARLRTRRFVQNKKFDDGSPIWSIVKPAFMQVQSNKCVFCERQLEAGPIEHDLEHFRPKSSVKEWPDPDHPVQYSFATGAASSKGYYWIAYDVQNYAASCKQCNTPLKSNYFPIAGRRKTAPGPFAKLSTEKAFLCYPIGDGDDDPEDLITFVATTAVPAAKSGFKRRRGQIIIDFFQLNVREQLHRERARMLVLLGDALDRFEASRTDLDQRLIGSLTATRTPHAGCLRAFRRLWDDDRATAQKAITRCKEFLVSNNVAEITL